MKRITGLRATYGGDSAGMKLSALVNPHADAICLNTRCSIFGGAVMLGGERGDWLDIHRTQEMAAAASSESEWCRVLVEVAKKKLRFLRQVNAFMMPPMD